MKTTFLNLLIFILLFTCQLSYSQEKSISFKRLVNSNELSQNTNQFISIDGSGYLWISSLDGINIFDGKQITIYKPNNNDTNSIRGENIQSTFFEDNDKKIWFSTNEALNYYNRKSDKFDSFILNSKQIYSNHYAFFLENKRFLWIVTEGELYRFDTKTLKKGKPILTGFNNAIICNVYINKDGSKTIFSTSWSENLGGELIKLDSLNRVLSRKTYLKGKNKLTLTNSFFINSDSIWIRSLNELILLNTLQKNDYQTFQIKGNISSIIDFSEDYFLLLKNKSSIHFFNKKTKKIENNSFYPLELDLNKRIESIDNIFMTNDTTLWIHKEKGSLYFTTMKGNGIKSVLNQNNISPSYNYGLVEREKSLVTSFSGIGKAWTFQDEKLIKEENIAPYYKELIDNADTIWNISAKGLTLKTKEAQKNIISSDEIAIFSDILGYKKQKLILATNQGIHFFDKKKLTVQKTDISEWIFKIFLDSKNRLWASDVYSNLYLFEISGTKVDSLKIIKHFSNFGLINDIKEDTIRNCLWIGTSKGLTKIDANSLNTTYITESNEGLPNQFIQAVLINDNDIWLSTNNGIVRFYPEQNKYRHFTERDGLSANEYSPGAALLSTSGKMWFGSSKGVDVFHPDSVKTIGKAPKIAINSLKIHGKEWMPNNIAVNFLNKFDLDYSQNNIVLELAALEYTDPIRNEFKTYLTVNGKTDSTYLGTKNTISYANLAPGNYLFEFTACNAEKIWQKEKRKLRIIINPPFWQTWWFYLTLTLTAISAAFALYRYRVGLVRKEEAQKTAVANLNLQVVETEMKALKAQMNPHFLFNSMNSIKGLILKQNTRKASEYLTKFSVLLRSILANSEKRHILLVTELETLRLYIDLEALRFTREIDYQIETTPDIDIDFISVPPLVLQPFVENAIWHGLLPKKEGKNSLRIHIEREQDFIIYTIQDNGIGRAAAAKPKTLSTHKSMGIGITRKRIELIHPENSIQIIDLHDKKGKATGTQVVLRIYEPE